MTYEIALTNRKIEYLISNKLNFEVIQYGDPTSIVKIEVSSPLHVLSLIHAGEEASLKLYTKK